MHYEWHSSDFTLGTGALTIECWFWRENITDSWQVLVADNLYQNTGGWTLYTKEDDIRFYKGGGEIWNVTRLMKHKLGLILQFNVIVLGIGLVI